MATIIERKRKDRPSSWQVIVRVKGIPATTRTFDSKAEAEWFSLETEKEFRIRAEKENSPEATQTLEDFKQENLKDLLRRFLKSTRAIDRHKRVLPTVIRNLNSTDKIENVRQGWMDRYVDKMRAQKTRVGRQFTYDTIVTQINILLLAIRWWAVKCDVDYPNIVFSTKNLPVKWQSKRERRLSPEEERLLFARLRRLNTPRRSHWRLLVRLAIETAARLQELLLAEWREFDLRPTHRTWKVPAGHTKTDTPRSIPLTKRAVKILKFLQRIRSRESSLVFHPFTNKSREGKMETRCGSASGFFHRISQEAGLVDFRFHDLRHEGVARFIVNNPRMPMLASMQAFGHASMAMTHRYAQLRANEHVLLMDK
ncbi:site-specific integrase [Caballeronia sp. TF1N1]|uniref:site-specific integrase n=1 Tax=Caballeronia sp. TF1N1 TaxID=2878153 RepID=UPI001FD5AF9C|nr:site-specific integrase [Caballeronia sp. TF1N1]